VVEGAVRGGPPPARRALDPDSLAALEEERDFLLRSLDDLEREHAAGDVDAADHAELKDDYTARAAAVIRSIEQRQEAMAAAAPPRSVGRRLVWGGLVVAFAVLAGVLIAQASGTRKAGDTASGEILADTRTLLSEGQQLAAARDYKGSIERYTKALELSPSNVEALTYRGWSRFRDGDAAGAAVDVDDAIAFDPDYPDARVFRASLHLNAGEADAAAEQLRIFDTLPSPPMMQQVLAAQRLRERIALARVAPVFLVTDPPALSGSGRTADEVFLAAQQLDADGKAADELKLLDVLVRADPTDKRAVAYRAWVLARVGVAQKQSSVIAVAVADLDKVLRNDPAYAPALVFRSFTLHFGSGRSTDAKADLAAFDALATKPADLVALIDEFDLRTAIAEATGTR
jgi:tetratricopeptide (TPR) repeat protein